MVKIEDGIVSVETNEEKRAKRKRLGRLSRNKGKVFEQEVARSFRKVFPDARRHLENHKDDAAKGIDLINVGRYLVQCKRLRGYASINKILEVQIDPIEGGCPILVTRGDNTEAMAVLPLHELLRLIANKERSGGTK